jgi:ubiquinone/menaquinone biosynthesis C-methylase UbiE
MAMPRAEAASFPVDFVGLAAETVPLDDRSVDTVLSTWTLCTIPDVAKALGEIRRVLRPDGQLIFVEHGRAPEARVVAWQDRLNPIQRRLAGGCNLNRKIDELIAAAGFRITRIETEYLKGPKPWTYTYKGLAKPG